MMFPSFVLILFVLNTRPNSIRSHCLSVPTCDCDGQLTTLTCDGLFGNPDEGTLPAQLSLLPPFDTYQFLNFKQIQSHAFANVSFGTNRSIEIQLINITTIARDAFSNTMFIPDGSTLSIDIGQMSRPSNLYLKSNAFDHMTIKKLRFHKIDHFNDRSIFDTDCFGSNLQVNELVFERTGLTGFVDVYRKAPTIRRLQIQEAPALSQLTAKSLPSFLPTIKSLEISTTGLKLINSHTFPGWNLVLEELIIENNPHLINLPSDMVDGSLIKLNTFDLSFNPIHTLDPDLDWRPYEYTKNLLLRGQQFDLFLKSNILDTLKTVQTLDFSDSFILDNRDDLIRKYFPSMSHLLSIDISRTNLTAQMLIDLLARISYAPNRTVTVSLFGLTLDDNDFCSYYSIYQQSPQSLRLELDPSHECNCIVDLFFGTNEQSEGLTINNLVPPTCLLNSTRIPCNIQTQIALSKCKIDGQKPDPSLPDDNNWDKYIFAGVISGVAFILLLIMAIGSTAVYRARRNRHNTDLDMEQPVEPVENPLTTIIQERLQNSH